MNQVYFYTPWLRLIRLSLMGLNPFMNQVYFYGEIFLHNDADLGIVLIPL